MTQASDATMRYCFALDLKNDPALIARYKDWHRAGAVPQAINRSIRNADIRELEIWQTGDRLFMIMTVGPDFSPEAKAQADRNDPEVQAWEQMMWEFQKPLPFAQADEKWVGMQRIYALNEQP
ncbi:MAG: L-rhamnose mutarotase [Asticcacaulis sp.]